ncbi:ligand-binding sensor domain-containing protein [Thalassotalea sp. PLHSN55]|uniref:ligand-binding sensor domain-containing protein n=1 Tax=Thalassotalea sp. PLHSN55 TaxID=3435888 RepID=UPI003F869972
MALDDTKTRRTSIAFYSQPLSKWYLPLPLSSLIFTSLIFFASTSFANQVASISQLKNVTDIAQDDQGFIWLSSQKGLTRYDGNSIINFASNNPQWKMPFNWTHSISKADNKLLVGTESQGLWEVAPRTGEKAQINLTISNNTIYNAIKYQQQYYAYTVSPKAIYRYQPKSESTQLLGESIALDEFFIFKKRLFFFNNLGIYEITGDNIRPFFTSNIKQVSVIKNKIIVATDNELIALDEHQQTIKIPLENPIQAMTAANDLSGVYSLDINGKITLLNHTLTEIPHHYSPDKKIKAQRLFHDTSGVLWLLNSQEILQLSQAYNIRHEKTFDTGAENAIEITPLNSHLVLGSYGAGIYDFNANNNFLPDNINDFFTDKALKVMDLQTVGNDIYIATFDGLWKYHGQKRALTKVDIENNQQILLKLAHRHQHLYIGTDENGFIIYDIKAQKVISAVNDTTKLSSTEIIDLLPISDETLWLATANGIDVFNTQTRQMSNITLPITSKVISLTQSQNKIFASTHGDGIFVFNRNQEILAHIAKDMNFTYIRALKDYVWVPTKQGLYQLNPQDYQMTLVPNTEDLSFSSEPVLFDNHIFAAHYGGILEVPLTRTDYYHAQIHIGKTTISGKYFIENKSINVKSTNEVIAFELTSSDYRKGQPKQFRYHINNGRWHAINGNQLTLTGLASGNYKITVEGTNSLGQWSNHQAFAEINVAYPPYWTPKMKIIYAVTLTGVLILCFWLLYLRARSIRQIHELLAKDVSQRSKTSLNINKSLTSAIELLNTIQDEEALKQVHQARSMIHQALAELDGQIQSDEPDNLEGKSLNIALPYLGDYLHKKFNIEISTKVEINEKNLSYELQSDIYKIVYEALTSAIINGNGSSYHVIIQEFKNKIWLTISDNENSFISFKSKVKFDMAMYYIRQIANKYSASVNTFDEHEKGSQLVISIPLMSIS